MPTLSVAGAELYYESHGSGPGLVFAHGAGGNHLSWWNQVPVFSDRYTCVTFDHRGFGRSLDPSPPEERPRFDEDLAALVDHLGFDDVRLVAQSMGGWTCLGYTLRHPERVKGLVMADTPGGLTSPELDAAREAARKELERQPIATGAVGPTFRELNPAGTFLYAQISGLNLPLDQILGRNSPMQRLGVTAEEAATIRTPVLFIEGEEDQILPPAIIELAHKMIPGSKMTMVPKSGHSVYFERPDVFNRLLAEFLAGIDG